MNSPQVAVPLDAIERHLGFILQERLNLEVFLSAGSLDTLGPSEVMGLLEPLTHRPRLTLHAPFMDLSPGAVDPKASRITRERFSQVFDVAELVRPAAVVFHSGYEKWKYDHKVEAWLEGSLGFWPEFIQRAGELGTVIAVENIFEDEPSSLVRLMEELGGAHMGVCFDTGHFNLFSKLPLAQWIGPLGPHLKETHLHDNDRGYDSHLAMGEGSFDFDGYFELIKGRDVILTVETHTPEGVRASLRRLAGYHKTSI